jgi:hypothetical protein
MQCESVNGNQVKLRAVYDEQNKTWAQYTPCGEVSMTIDNPTALERFTVGQHYFVDFTPAPAKEADEKA